MATKLEILFKNWEAGIRKQTDFIMMAVESPCVKSAVVKLYVDGYPADSDKSALRTTGFGENTINTAANTLGISGNFSEQNRKSIYSKFDSSDINKLRIAAIWVWNNKKSEAESVVNSCINSSRAKSKSENIQSNGQNDTKTIGEGKRPFDKRLDRFETESVNSDKRDGEQISPFHFAYNQISTSGYIMQFDTLKESDSPDKNKLLKTQFDAYKKMKQDDLYLGVPSLQNHYSITRLAGSKGGEYLVNEKGKRRWYEIDVNEKTGEYNYASNPTTSVLIDWGAGDPYGRTPYLFTDFVFCKYWKKITNNRLITLRRYAAPILDNLKFPGMTSTPAISSAGSGNSGRSEDHGSVKNEFIPFPPMATVVTYFGGDTGNSLSSILKFTTGVLWDDAQADIWNAQPDQVPDSRSGPAGMFGGIARFAEMLNVAGGNFDRDLVMNQGALPPDPYKDGPYENRIMGPINRIDSVKKRKPGLSFEWGGIDLVFEYVGRPIGGINPKAVLLDIMSNFLVIGSASAVFFGGAHRFMANPAKYPFLGGDEGIEKWYRGDPMGWGLTVVKQFAGGGSGSVSGAGTNILESMGGFFKQLFSGEKGSGFAAITSLFSGGIGNIISNKLASKSAGQIPFMSGMKAILTGEPVGEWHVTIGNPLNPIAMIGNLVCDGITVEFNEELGPDDFPTEMKVTVKLNHAMARDRDAIESVFNRGMGRIYALPDDFLGSADYQTAVDAETQNPVETGLGEGGRVGILYRRGMDSRRLSISDKSIRTPSNAGSEISVWDRQSFSLGISENSTTQILSSDNRNPFRNVFRKANWIAQKSLK